LTKGLEKVSDSFDKTMENLMTQKERMFSIEEKHYEKQLALINKKYKDEDERAQAINKEKERHRQKGLEIEQEAKVASQEADIIKAKEEVEILSKKVEIENRDIKEEFEKQVSLYEKQLSDARTEIQQNAHRRTYNLNYNPPKIVEQGGKKRVEPGTVSYRIDRECCIC